MNMPPFAASSPRRRRAQFFGEGGPEFSPRSYGRQYVACRAVWLAAPYTIAAPGECAVWLRVRTGPSGCSLSLWAPRADVLSQVRLSSPGEFTWQRVEAAPGTPLLIKATAGENTVTLRNNSEPFDLDRLCVTNDLKFVPADEPRAKLPAPHVRATPLSPFEVKLELTAAPSPLLTPMRCVTRRPAS